MKKIIISLLTVLITTTAFAAKPKVTKQRDKLRLFGYKIVIETELIDPNGNTTIKLVCKDAGDDPCKKSKSCYVLYNQVESDAIDQTFDYVEGLIPVQPNGTYAQNFNFLNVNTGLLEIWNYSITWTTNADESVTEIMTPTQIQ